MPLAEIENERSFWKRVCRHCFSYWKCLPLHCKLSPGQESIIRWSAKVGGFLIQQIIIAFCNVGSDVDDSSIAASNVACYAAGTGPSTQSPAINPQEPTGLGDGVNFGCCYFGSLHCVSYFVRRTSTVSFSPRWTLYSPMRSLLRAQTRLLMYDTLISWSENTLLCPGVRFRIIDRVLGLFIGV